MKYKKKIIETIEAIQYTGQNSRDIAKWMDSIGDKKFYIDRYGDMVITTYAGPIIVKPWYYILYDENDGSYSIMSPDDFEKEYEPEDNQ